MDLDSLRDFFKLYWNWVKTYSVPEDTDKWWKSLLDSAKEIESKYTKDEYINKFVQNELINYINCVDNKVRAMNSNQDISEERIA